MGHFPRRTLGQFSFRADIESPDFQDLIPRIGNASPIESQSPRAVVDPEAYMSMKMTYSLEKKDCEGAWSWGPRRNLLDAEWQTIIEPRLSPHTKETWKEISAHMVTNGRHLLVRNHHQEISSIREEAQTRWQEILLEEYPSAFRFRLGGKRRLWGIRIISTFYVVWWDHLHKIYEVDP